MTLPEDVNYLKMLHFIPESIMPSDINDNLPLHEVWATAFWRRRKKHSQRTDPEIKYLKQNSIEKYDKVLEIGGAYGRVTSKLAELDQISTITSIEICQYFSDYSQQYIDGNDDIKFVFDDFLTSRSFNRYEFDLVVLPMNTMPSFPRKHLNQLLERVRMVLRPGGRFLFSTYPENIREMKEDRYDGELLVETGSDPLAIEFYTMSDRVNPWGIKSITYSKYRFLTEEEQESETIYFKTERNFFHHDYLVKLLHENHLTVISRDQIDHSTVFVCEPRDEK